MDGKRMTVRRRVTAFELPLVGVHLREDDVVERREAVQRERLALGVDNRSERVAADDIANEIPDASVCSGDRGNFVEVGRDNRLLESVRGLDDVLATCLVTIRMDPIGEEV